MSDRYSTLIRTPVGQLLAKNLGLPNPVPLERWTDGAPLVDGTVVLGGAGRLEKSLVAALDNIAAGHYPSRPETKNLCTMCAFTAVCRHLGGVE